MSVGFYVSVLGGMVFVLLVIMAFALFMSQKG